MTIGEVILVGGGPGDPDLLTVGGLRALQQADVVLYDHLAPVASLSECRPGTVLIEVGKIPGARRVGRAWRFHRESLLKWLSCTGPDTHGKRRKR